MQIDRDLLAERWPVQEWYARTRQVNVLALAQAVRRSALVFGWFASWHTFWPVVLAQLFRKPSVLVIGGYDLANLPAISYGHQRGGLKKWLSQWVMRSATDLITNAEYSRTEAQQNAGLDSQRVQVVYHGVPDPFGALPLEARAPLVLTVGNVDESTLRRKGLLLFVQAAAHLPEVAFVVAGRWQDRAITTLRAHATPNVTFTNFLTTEALLDYYRQASVYVQASAHEGFGLSVAEAMLAGCIPVVTRAGALPEVVGDTGQYVAATPSALMAGIQTALAAPVAARSLVRERILSHFPVAARRQGLWTAVEKALAHA